MDKTPIFVGIDVAKHRLDVHLRPSGESFTIDYSEEEVAALIERLVALAPALSVLEATGGLEVRLAVALAAAALVGVAPFNRDSGKLRGSADLGAAGRRCGPACTWPRWRPRAVPIRRSPGSTNGCVRPGSRSSWR